MLERLLLASRTPGPPLVSPDFERAIKYRVNPAGKPGTEQAVRKKEKRGGDWWVIGGLTLFG